MAEGRNKTYFGLYKRKFCEGRKGKHDIFLIFDCDVFFFLVRVVTKCTEEARKFNVQFGFVHVRRVRYHTRLRTPRVTTTGTNYSNRGFCCSTLHCTYCTHCMYGRRFRRFTIYDTNRAVCQVMGFVMDDVIDLLTVLPYHVQ